jgi:glycerol-3-phosphate dehydrogenase (NAD(P)+)
MGLGDNARAALMTRGLAEIARLGVAMGADPTTFAGLTGIGDLIVTCTSLHSRNYRTGLYIGQGLSPEEAIQRVGMTVEGCIVAGTAWELAKEKGVEMPIVEQLNLVLCEHKDVRLAVRDLMGRPSRHENEKIWLQERTLTRK